MSIPGISSPSVSGDKATVTVRETFAYDSVAGPGSIEVVFFKYNDEWYITGVEITVAG